MAARAEVSIPLGEKGILAITLYDETDPETLIKLITRQLMKGDYTITTYGETVMKGKLYKENR